MTLLLVSCNKRDGHSDTAATQGHRAARVAFSQRLRDCGKRAGRLLLLVTRCEL
jgi:hypothetical protein